MPPGEENVTRDKIVLHQSEESYSVFYRSAGLLVAGGATKAEALENIRATIREYLTAVEE